MGRLIGRFWNAYQLVSRPAVEADPLSGIFHAYVPHPITGFKLLFNADTWHRVHTAEQALAALPEAAVAPAEWLLAHAESAASSTIEGIRPSARRLARAEAQLVLGKQKPRYDDLETLGNISATRLAVKIGAENQIVTTDDICAIHASLMGDDPEAGKIRSGQSWISSGISSTPLDAAFVPPPPETVPALIEDLVAAINEPAASPLAHAAVIHAQFETIHPFSDGNGRTGRALIQLMLRRSGLSSAYPPPISSALALNKDAYISALNSSHPVCDHDDAKRSAALTQWIMLCADACVQACDYTSRIISHVADLQQTWRDQLLLSGVRSSNSVMRLIKVLPANPIVNVTTVAGLLAVTTRTAQRSIDLLVNTGILVQRNAGKRNRVYEAEAVMDIFATLARVGRDGGGLNLPPSTNQPQQ